jgi:four helix bundle protein
MQRPVFRFEKLEVWQLARQFNHKVYVASRSFPAEERYALTSQLHRASASVSSNIAEGSGRNSDPDFAHFLEVAYGSLMEVVSQLFLASDEGYLPPELLAALLVDADQLAGKLVALSKSLGRDPRINRPPQH